MSESASHKRIKRREVGRGGVTETPLAGGRRLDASNRDKAVEVERSGRTSKLQLAAERLRASGKKQHVLLVPQKDLPKAVDAMKKAGTGGTIKNLSGTRKRTVPKPPKPPRTKKRT